VPCIRVRVPQKAGNKPKPEREPEPEDLAGPDDPDMAPGVAPDLRISEHMSCE